MKVSRNYFIFSYIYIYIYIYIYSHPQTDCFVRSELFSVARHVGCSKPGSKPIQLYVRQSLRPLGQQAHHVWLREFLKYYVVPAATVCLHFYTLSATRELNSFEELLHYASGGRKFLHQSAQPPYTKNPKESNRIIRRIQTEDLLIKRPLKRIKLVFKNKSINR